MRVFRTISGIGLRLILLVAFALLVHEAPVHGQDDWFWKGGTTNPMYDYDQKQDAWGANCPQWEFTWCGPVALANSIAWYADNIRRGLVPAQYRDPQGNVDPVALIQAIAATANGGTPGCDGVTCSELAGMAQNWINTYAPGAFEVHFVPKNDFGAMCQELRRTQDVIILFGFYDEVEPGVIERAGGHFVTLAGCGTVGGQPEIAFSDPYWDGNAIGVRPGRSNGPHGDTRQLPNNPTNHNNPANYSHDQFGLFMDPSGQLGLVTAYPPPMTSPFARQNQGPDRWVPSQPGTFIDCVFAISPKEGIPTLGEWGFIILGALVLASGVFYIYRRRHLATVGV